MATPLRVKELTNSIGLGPLLLEETVQGPEYRSFDAAAGGADLAGLPYCTRLTEAGLFEIGYGAYVAASGEFERQAFVASSSGTWISWPRGAKEHYVTIPATEVMLGRDDLEGVGNQPLSRANLGMGTVAARAVGVASGAEVPDLDAADSRYGAAGVLLGPSGARLLLAGGSIPAGWTRSDQADDRVWMGAQSGDDAGDAGGDWSPGATFTVANHQLTVAQMASHSHAIHYTTSVAILDGIQLVTLVEALTTEFGSDASFFTGGTGGLPAQVHSHGISDDGTWRPQHKRAVEIVKD